MRHVATIALIALCMTLSPVTSAQEVGAELTEGSAEEHSRRGVELYAEGKLPEAVREMLKAYELAPESGLLYNIARIYQKMGQRDLAIHYLKQFVTQPGADPDRVQKALKHLETLEKAPASPSQPLPPSDPAPAPVTPPSEVVDAPGDVAPAESPPNLAGWITLGAGSAALIVGGVLGGLALSSAGDLEADSLGYADKRDAQQSARGMALGADISMGVGIAAAVTGLVLLLLPADEDDAASNTRFAPSLSPGRVGGLLTVRFP